MRKLFCVFYILCALGGQAQEVISLAGPWDFSLSDSVRFDDYVMLPGSMLTNGKGHAVSVDTRWTGSLYDSSFFYNPSMEKYRHEGDMDYLKHRKHYAWWKYMREKKRKPIIRIWKKRKKI